MSPARKKLLMAACALGALYLVWLATSVMKLLPAGPWTAWYVGFGILGMATVMAAIALRRDPPTQLTRETSRVAPRSRQTQTLTPRRPARLNTQSTQRPSQGVAGAAQPADDLRAFNQHTFDDDDQMSSQDLLETAHSDLPSVPLIKAPTPDLLGLMLTPTATPEPPEPISFDEPLITEYAPETSTLAQWIEEQGANNVPSASSQPAQAEVVQVSAHGSAPPSMTLTGLTASPPEATVDIVDQNTAMVSTSPSLDDNIQIMTSVGRRVEKSAAERAFEDASLSSIDAAIKQYTVELYDMGEDDQLSRTLDEVLNINSLTQAPQPDLVTSQPSSIDVDSMSESKRYRLEALKNKLNTSGQEHGGDLASLLNVATRPCSPLPEKPASKVTPQPYMDASQASSAPQDIHGMVLEPFTEGLGAMRRDEINRLWQDYAEASISCGRSPARVSYVRFYQQLVQHHEAISRQYDCENIRFRIKIKNGKPALSARPA